MTSVNNNFVVRQNYKYEGDDWWTWSIWIDGRDSDLDQINVVTYTLHSSFRNPVQHVKDRYSKFKLETAGWGVFMIYVKISLKNGEQLQLQHYLKLEYPDGTVNTA